MLRMKNLVFRNTDTGIGQAAGVKHASRPIVIEIIGTTVEETIGHQAILGLESTVGSFIREIKDVQRAVPPRKRARSAGQRLFIR